MSRSYRPKSVTERIVADDGRWILGDPNARCHKCDAPAAVTYAGNGKAEVWHAPTDCCAYAREREARFHAMAIADEQHAQDAFDRAKGWPHAVGEAA